MVKIGFPVPAKKNEKRRALLPADLGKVSDPSCLVFETGYGASLGISDDEYVLNGARVAAPGDVIECPVICNPRPLPDEHYYKKGKTLFGWIHAVQGRRMTDCLAASRMTAIAWEEMFEDKRHVFWQNNEIAGEASVEHAFLQWGKQPHGCRAAVIGRGNTARGALRALERAGAEVTVYTRATVALLPHEISRYDVIVNAVLWDVFRTDHLVTESDLLNMKTGSMIIDISCDEAMGIESSRPTTIDEPVYWHKGILHYAVDNTPSLFWISASEVISRAVAPYINDIVNETRNPVLDNATIIREGTIIDQKILRFQKRL